MRVATAMSMTGCRHLKRVVTEKYEHGQLVYKRTKHEEHVLVEHLALRIQEEVNTAVDAIVQQIEQQNTRLNLAPSLTVVPENSWHAESARHAAELYAEMENLKSDFDPGPSAEQPNDVDRRLLVLAWLDKVKNRAVACKPVLDTFAEVSAQVHNNLNIHWTNKLQATTENFTQTMLDGLVDIDAYRRLYSQAFRTASQSTAADAKREFYQQFGALAEVELVAKAHQHPCVTCRPDLAYPWAMYRDLGAFTVLCDVDSRDRGRDAWLAVQMFMAGDTDSVMDLVRSAYVMQGGAVKGPVSLHALQEHAPSHYSLWGHDSKVRYWAQLKTMEGPLFLPTAVALSLWPDLRSETLDVIRREEQARVEHAYETKRLKSHEGDTEDGEA